MFSLCQRHRQSFPFLSILKLTTIIKVSNTLRKATAFDTMMKRTISTSEKESADLAAAATKPVHTCDQCQEIFTSRNQLFIHLRNRHVNSNNQATSDISGTVTVVDELRTAYEDDLCKVIVKPQGMATMGTRSGITVYNHPLLRIDEHFGIHCGYRKATPCHRLDALTGGLLICAKSLQAERLLCFAFRERKVTKRYLAIIQGRLPTTQGLIDQPLSGQKALTRFAVTHETPSRDYGWLTTVSLWPITGRKHQLRKHLQFLGCPIVGDRRYTSALTWSREFPQLFLWAVELQMPHPRYLLTLEEQSKPIKHIVVPASSLAIGTGIETNMLNAANEDDRKDNHEDDLQSVNSHDSDNDGNNNNDDKIEIASTDNTNSKNNIAGIRSAEGYQSAAELLLQSLRQQNRQNDILHVVLEEPAYYERFRQQQYELWLQQQSQEQKTNK